MTIKQLKYIVSIADNNFNISYAAEKLHTSQPGMSKQIKLLENEIGFHLFMRNGKALQGLSPLGEKLIEQARAILEEVEKFDLIVNTPSIFDKEVFKIAAAPIYSSKVLPRLIKTFSNRYPTYRLSILNGDTDQLIQKAKTKEVDCVIISGSVDAIKEDWFPNMVAIPCYEWKFVAIAKKGTKFSSKKPSMQELLSNPVVTYASSRHQESIIEKIRRDEDINIDAVATSNDVEVIKEYVRSGLGIGIIAELAYDKSYDKDFDAYKLDRFPRCITMVALKRNSILKPHVYSFIRLFAPHLTADDIEYAVNAQNKINLDKSFPSINLDEGFK